MKIHYIFFFIIFLLIGCQQSQDEVVWDMPTPFVDNVFHTKNIQQFVADIHKMTEGTVTIRVHTGASLYKQPEIKRAVRSGQVPIGEIVMSLLSNEDPIFEVDVLPLLATSYEKAAKLWQSSRPEIEDILDQQGLKLLYVVPWPPQGLFTGKPIQKMEDMHGLKIRSYNATLSRLVELLKGIPTTVQTPEIPQAFSAGIIDSMVTSPSTGVSSQSWDYVKYYYDFQAWIPKNMVFVNKKAFTALPKKHQQAIIAAAEQAEKRGWTMSEQETAEKLKILQNKGVKIMEPTDNLRFGLAKIRQKMAEEWKRKSGAKGQAILANYQRLLDENLFADGTHSSDNSEQPQ